MYKCVQVCNHVVLTTSKTEAPLSMFCVTDMSTSCSNPQIYPMLCCCVFVPWQAEEESQGVKLVRQGRAARLDAVHRQLFGGDKDRDRDRDRDQQQQQQQRPPSSSSAGSPARRFAAADGGAVNSSISSQAGGSSSVDAGATTAGSVGRFRPLAGSSAGGSPVRRFGGDSNTLTAAATATGKSDPSSSLRLASWSAQAL